MPQTPIDAREGRKEGGLPQDQLHLLAPHHRLGQLILHGFDTLGRVEARLSTAFMVALAFLE